MSVRMLGPVVVLLSLIMLAPAAEAQADRAEWLAWRAGKEARYARITPNPQRDVLVLTGIRAFPDPAGNIVIVGEARNVSGRPLAYTRVHFTFRGSDGRALGTEWSYLFGGSVMRLLERGLNENVLLPGATGFFKVWTAVPFAFVASHPMLSAGDDVPFGEVLASRSSPEAPPLYIPSPSLAGGQLSGRIVSTALPNDLLIYRIRVSAAVYENGTISDVQSTLAIGPRPGDPCSEEPATGILRSVSGDEATFSMRLARPGDFVSSLDVEWDERGRSAQSVSFTEAPDSRTLTVADRCGFAITVSDPWIRVVERPLPGQASGNLTIAVDRNTGGARAGTVWVNGQAIAVSQSHRCDYALAQTSFLAGPGLPGGRWAVPVTSNCSWRGESDSSWLSVAPPHVVQGAGSLTLSVVQPNTTGRTRRARVTVGNVTATVDQRPWSRAADLDGDDSLDLLWHHATDGRIAAWLMNGPTLRSGVPVGPGSVADIGWVPAAVADMNGDDAVDVIWRHRGDGRLATWSLRGTALQRGDLFASPTSEPDQAWQLRGTGDFNGDGRPDLVWQRDGTGELVAWFMTDFGRRTGTAALGPGSLADVQWKVAGSADFNLDGWPDLVLQHDGDGRLAVWLMSGTSLLEEVAVTPGQVSDLDWKIRAAGDINRDDRPDLIWQHRTTGDLAAWLMDGTRQLRAVSLGQVADTNWVLVGPR